MADPLRTRVGAQHGAGLKVVHDVARKAARHGYDAGDKEQLDLSDLCEGSHDEHDDEAKDLHGVDTRLAAALRAHDGGDKGEQRDDDGRDGTKVERDGNDHGDGCGAEPMMPASSLREPEMSDCSLVSVELSAARPRTMPVTCGRMS